MAASSYLNGPFARFSLQSQCLVKLLQGDEMVRGFPGASAE